MWTTQITVGTGAVAITTQTFCRQVRIIEDPSISGWPTTDYLIAKPFSSSTFIRQLAGTIYLFDSGPYQPGAIVGYVETVTGTTTFNQDET